MLGHLARLAQSLSSRPLGELRVGGGHHQAAVPAAPGEPARVLHLAQLDAGDGAQHLPRLIEDPSVAGELARVMVGDGLGYGLLEVQPAVGQKLGQNLANVEHLEGQWYAQQGGVVHLEGAVAVGAGEDDPAGARTLCFASSAAM